MASKIASKRASTEDRDKINGKTKDYPYRAWEKPHSKPVCTTTAREAVNAYILHETKRKDEND
jgi:hypothetical protein